MTEATNAIGLPEPTQEQIDAAIKLGAQVLKTVDGAAPDQALSALLSAYVCLVRQNALAELAGGALMALAMQMLFEASMAPPLAQRH